MKQTKAQKKQLQRLLNQWLNENYSQDHVDTSLRREQPLFVRVVQLILNELDEEISQL